MSTNPVKRPAVAYSVSLQIEFPPELRAVRRSALQFRALLKGCDFGQKDISDCELAFVEGCNNAVQHSSDRRRQIRVNVNIDKGQIELKISDSGQGFVVPDTIELPHPEKESGRGLYLMKALMDDVSYTRNASSNCLVLKKNLTGI